MCALGLFSSRLPAPFHLARCASFPFSSSFVQHLLYLPVNLPTVTRALRHLERDDSCVLNLLIFLSFPVFPYIRFAANLHENIHMHMWWKQNTPNQMNWVRMCALESSVYSKLSKTSMGTHRPELHLKCARFMLKEWFSLKILRLPGWQREKKEYSYLAHIFLYLPQLVMHDMKVVLIALYGAASEVNKFCRGFRVSALHQIWYNSVEFIHVNDRSICKLHDVVWLPRPLLVCRLCCTPSIRPCARSETFQKVTKPSPITWSAMFIMSHRCTLVVITSAYRRIHVCTFGLAFVFFPLAFCTILIPFMHSSRSIRKIRFASISHLVNVVMLFTCYEIW